MGFFLNVLIKNNTKNDHFNFHNYEQIWFMWSDGGISDYP